MSWIYSNRFPIYNPPVHYTYNHHGDVNTSQERRAVTTGVQNSEERRAVAKRLETGRDSKQQPSGEKISIYDTMNESVPTDYKTNARAVEEWLEEDFSKLSVDDRSQIAQEIDGTHCMAVEETPELLESSLAKLETELEAIPYKKKVGYLQSQKLPQTLINNPNFRLRFLRCHLFDEREAAIRLVKYCDFVLELFGIFALERHVELADLDKHEMKWFLKGYIQLMPFRDRSGRRVILQIMDSNVMAEQITRLKLYFYTAMVASADVETQRKGVVLVVWPGGPGKDWKQLQPSDKRARHLITQRHEVVPMRFAGYHYCMPDDTIFRLIRSFAVLFGGFGGEMTSRMRFHIGVDTELRYTIQGFGIPADLIPVTGSGNIKFNYLKQWINVRKIVEIEARSSGGIAITGRIAPETIVECPGSNDVIFKPGKRLDHHPGNIMFDELILSKETEYTTTSSKRGLYRWLIMEIKKRNGRFLKWNDDEYWTELKDEAQITVKISTSCKSVLKKQQKLNKAKKNKTLVECSTSAFTVDTNSSNKRQRCDNLDILPCSAPR